MFLSDNANIEVLPAGYGDCIFMSIHKMNMVFNILVAGTNVDPVMRCSWWKRIVEQVYFYRADSLNKCIGELQK